jgi:hypothetical protein
VTTEKFYELEFAAKLLGGPPCYPIGLLVEQLIPIGPLYGISIISSSTIAAEVLDSTSSHQELIGVIARAATAAVAAAATSATTTIAGAAVS